MHLVCENRIISLIELLSVRAESAVMATIATLPVCPFYRSERCENRKRSGWPRTGARSGAEAI